METSERTSSFQEIHEKTDIYMAISDAKAVARLPTLKIAMIDARKAPAIAASFFEHKRACYARFGAATAAVAAYTSAPRDKTKELHLVIAFEPDTGAMVGGLALYGRGPNSPLPMEKAIGSMGNFKQEIASWRDRKLVEFAGFWLEDVWRKTGLSEQIVLSAIAGCRCMGADKVVALAHHHVIDSYRTMGVILDASLAPFHYPTPDYLTALIWADPIALSTVPLEKQDLVSAHAHRLKNGGVIEWFCDDEAMKTACPTIRRH